MVLLLDGRQQGGNLVVGQGEVIRHPSLRVTKRSPPFLSSHGGQKIRPQVWKLSHLLNRYGHECKTNY
jgi:hypothetical protein